MSNTQRGRPRTGLVLDAEAARRVCQRAWDGDPPSEIAEDEHCSTATVSSIKTGVLWPEETYEIRRKYDSSAIRTRAQRGQADREDAM